MPRALGSGKVELFVVDADGFPGRDLWLFKPLLAHGCVLVFDDYESDAAPEKARPVSDWVKRAIGRGLVEDLGVHLWGTWVGRYRRPSFGGLACGGRRARADALRPMAAAHAAHPHA